MAHEMKRQEKRMPEAEALDLIKNAEYGVFSTQGEDGAYGVPVHAALLGETLYIHCALTGHKLENIKADPRVCFSVVEDVTVVEKKFTTRFKSALAFGRARLAQGDEKRAGLLALVEKFAPEHKKSGATYIDSAFDKTAVIAIDVDRIVGKEAPAKGS